MNCQKYEKWISDGLDKTLSVKDEALLEKHLSDCAACREYKHNLEALRSEISEMKKEEVSPAYLQGFTSRLNDKLALEGGEKSRPGFLTARLKWGYVLAPVFIATVIAIVFFLPGRRFSIQEDLFAYSLNDTLEQISLEIDEDPALMERFNSMILASIEDSLDLSQIEDRFDLIDSSSLFDEITEEDLKYLEAQIKKQTKT